MKFSSRLAAAGNAVLPVVALPRTLLVKARTRPLDSGMFAGKRVALVGNAKSALREGNAALIDAHDIVIRMNLGHPLIVRRDLDEAALPSEWIDAAFTDRRTTGADRLVLLKPSAPDEVVARFANARFIGRRTDIWSCSSADAQRQLFFRDRFPCLHVACHPHLFHLRRALVDDPAFRRLPDAVFRTARRKLRVRPSSGVIWLEYLRALPVEAVDLFGFDFFQSGHVSRTTQLKVVEGGYWPHDGAAERDYCLAVIDADPRLSLR